MELKTPRIGPGGIGFVAVVDDDPPVRDSTRLLLRSYGYRVETFASAEEFVQCNLLENTLALITDVRLPGMSGLDLQSRLRAHRRATPIIFITAFDDEHIKRHALAGGALGFLLKPVDHRALIDLLPPVARN